MQTKVYLAGPMTGYPSYNVLAFETSAEVLRKQGYAVITPFDTNSRVWRRHYGKPFDPHTDTCDYGSPLLREMIAEDIKVLLESDKVVFLPGWEHSRGARLEFAVARTVGIPCEHIDGTVINDVALIVVTDDEQLENVALVQRNAV